MVAWQALKRVFGSGEQESQGGPRVSLRPLRKLDARNIRKWRRDPELLRMTVVVPGPEFEVGPQDHDESTERYIQALLADPRRVAFAVLEDGEHVGNIGLKDWEPGRMESECFVELGDARHRGRGVGSRAMALLLDMCFERMGLMGVSLTVFEFNAPAIHMYERLGFTHSGPTGWHWDGANYCRVLAMSISRDVWQERRQGAAT